MTRTKVSRLARLLALGAGALFLTWGVGADASDAQHHDDHGGHDDHGTTTSQATTSTSQAGSSSSTSGPSSTTSTTAPHTPGGQVKTVRYGPFTIPAAPPPAPGDPHGHGSHAGSFAINVEKACTDCYITRMVPDMVKADGTRAGRSNGLQLHHMVMFNRQQGRSDATCSGNPLFSIGGQRFFASGDERSTVSFPPDYGYKVNADSMWVLLWDLASTSSVEESVYITVTFEYVPATPNMLPIRDVEPVWMDVDQCGDSEVSVPAGPATTSYTWTVNRPGEVVSVFSHLHDHGKRLETRNDATNQRICDSVAGYGEWPLFVDDHGMEHISSMASCTGTVGRPGLGLLTADQRVTITGHYDAPAAVEDAMAIAVLYIAEPAPQTGPSCTSAMNMAHVQAGRATAWLLWTWAKGSNEYVGFIWDTVALREEPAGTWRRTQSCPS